MVSIDYSGMVSSADVATAVAVIVAFGGVWLVVDFTVWAVHEVGCFFDDVSYYRFGQVDQEWSDRFDRNSAVTRVGDWLNGRR